MSDPSGPPLDESERDDELEEEDDDELEQWDDDAGSMLPWPLIVGFLILPVAIVVAAVGGIVTTRAGSPSELATGQTTLVVANLLFRVAVWPMCIALYMLGLSGSSHHPTPVRAVLVVSATLMLGFLLGVY